jgi:hypothetical protein
MSNVIPLHSPDYLRQAYELIDGLLDDDLTYEQQTKIDGALELIQMQIEVKSAGLLPSQNNTRPVH